MFSGSILRLMALGKMEVVIFISWELTKGIFQSLEIPIILDEMALGFLFTVRAISGTIYYFSLGYMSQEKFFVRFHLLVFSFIVSMVLLILSPNLVRILLG